MPGGENSSKERFGIFVYNKKTDNNKARYYYFNTFLRKDLEFLLQGMHEKLIAFNLHQRKSRNTPELQSGDVVKIHRKIREGSKERTQVFQGTIIAMRGGQSSSPTITVWKVSFGVGVELVMPVLSPQIEKIEFIKRTSVRRAKLYFVRDKSVKVLSRKMKEIDVKTLVFSDKAEAAVEEPEIIAPEEKVAPSPVPEKTEEVKS